MIIRLITVVPPMGINGLNVLVALLCPAAKITAPVFIPEPAFPLYFQKYNGFIYYNPFSRNCKPEKKSKKIKAPGLKFNQNLN